MRGVKTFLKDATGASAAEYGLILGIVIVIGATAIMALAPGVNTLYTRADETVAQNASAATPDDDEGSQVDPGNQ